MRTLVVTPTYLEAENITEFLTRLRAAVPEADVLVVDDNSPDGTGDLAEKAAADLGQITVMHRPAKSGLGVAYRAGFAWGLERDYEVLVQIDADLSHDPAVLPTLLEALDGGADLVIGSRYVPGGRVVNWPWHRQLLSRGGNVYTRLLLGMPVRDATAGYRVFRRTTLERIHLDEVVSLGYVFQADLAFRAVRAGLRVVEVPIDFVEREIGESKMSPQVAAESLKRITRWGLSERAGQLRGALEQRRHPTR